MAAEETPSCGICLEPLGDDLNYLAVGALKCGHVYHRSCIVQWITKTKANCPVCKMVNHTEDVRTLEFDLKRVPAQSAEELHRLEAATLEERARRREELCAEMAEAEADAAEVDAELELLRNLSQDRKRQRLEVEEQSKVLQAEFLELSEELETQKSLCFRLQAGIDADAPRRQRKLPVNAPREGDTDLREERRKLRGGPGLKERTRQLHEALTSAIDQENEKMKDKKEREAALKQSEDELRDLRHLEAQLRRELEERRESSNASSQGSTLPPASPATSSDKSQVVAAEMSRRQIAVEVATPLGKALCRLGADDSEDMDMLYGGAPARRHAGSTRLGLLAKGATASRSGNAAANALPTGGADTTAKTAGTKWGALFRPSSKTNAEAPISSGSRMMPGEIEAKPSMKTMFANRVA